jgi:hypothetical protein
MAYEGLMIAPSETVVRRTRYQPPAKAGMPRRLGMDGEEINASLRPTEHVQTWADVDAFFASKHSLSPSSPRVVLTNQRFLLFSQRGTFRKRFQLEPEWPLTAFGDRINASEGTALGPFMYFVTLFTHDDETVSSAFKSARQRDDFRLSSAGAVAAANGWN